MTLNVPDTVRRGWTLRKPVVASASDVAMLESALGARLPAEYVAFITHQGFVEFGNDDDDTSLFTYVLEGDGQREVRQGQASFMRKPERAIQAWRVATGQSDPNDPSLPLIPPGFFPFGGDPGQGLLLIELATGAVWFWPDRASRWGSGDNTRLGRVAPDFDGFVNGLRPASP